MPKTITPAACCEAPRPRVSGTNASMASVAAGGFRGSHMSKETKHTPRPWIKVFLNGHWHVAQNNGRVEIAKIAAYNKDRANAQLIVLAHDLLDVCESLLGALKMLAGRSDRNVSKECADDMVNIAAMEAEEVIAKAKGGAK